MKENVRNFLKKAEADPQLAARLDIARQHYIKEVMLLAGEAGVSLKHEDFFDETAPLTDSEVSEASGGIRLPWQPIDKNGHFVFF
ncbi:hypothetical protein DW886_23770 [Enterocloster aldenensis]|uniref:hypothetical protein n=1 Tax=Enterocloster aldenensis TaxID=358742 RepID=UPI000E46756D|nr:hypothetical protein DW886_23770 [Enterocloster aldenensis]